MNNKNSPGQDQDSSKWTKEPEAGNNFDYDTNSKSLETDGPDKTESFNVLNQDGSLADMPEEDADGKGALDGTVGLGT